jgi:hypothetical protein
VWQLKLSPTAWLCYEALACQPCCSTDSRAFNREQMRSEEAGQQQSLSMPLLPQQQLQPPQGCLAASRAHSACCRGWSFLCDIALDLLHPC